MKRQTQYLVILMTIFSLISAVPCAQAEGGNAWDYTVDISSKFGRGLTNIVTSPFEIPCNISEEMEGSPYKGFLLGTGKGLFKMGRRMFNGVLDIGTFMIPSPAEMPYVCQGRDERKKAAEAARATA